MASTTSPTTLGDGSPLPSPSFTRGSSPSPSISPSPALLACPPLDRCFSDISSVSSFSGRSSASRSSSGSAVSRRRGYVRPQGALFSESAKNRDSVMSLGSIAHLQYYFARTGLLDGKGGQLAKDSRKNSTNPTIVSEDTTDTLCLPSFGNVGLVSSPIEEEDSLDWDEPMMLPPTVSTYSHRTQYISPPPDAETMRRDLKDGLSHVEKAIIEVRKHKTEKNDSQDEYGSQQYVDLITPPTNTENSTDAPPSDGWHEIEGLHMLDVVTLAIRSAKIYYTMHEQPQRLASVKSERQIREELRNVLDVLKRLAARNFAGGIREEELDVMEGWVQSVEELLLKEEAMEEQEAKDRENWRWLEGEWSEKEREREWLFMHTFLEGFDLPEWTSPESAADLPTPFLEALRNGLSLVHFHNRVLKKSKRKFGEIRTFHTDTAKPYRAAENLRYWIKAAEIRWEIKLKVDVLGVVYGKGDQAWKDFDAAIVQWCRAVREEITQEWRQGSVRVASPLLDE